MIQENKMTAFILAVLRGMGQIMLQRNAVTGIFFLAGIFYNSIPLGLAALTGAVAGTVSAYVLRYAQSEIEDGLYGFNSALTGIAVLVFFELSIASILCVLAGSIISTMVMHEMKKKVPAYTAPFVLTAWVLILVLKWMGVSEPVAAAVHVGTLNFVDAAGFGLGQVMFQPNLITGILFLAGIAIHSRTAAGYALLAALSGALFAVLLSLPVESINNGIWGYNAVLCAIVLGGLTLRGFVLATAGIIFSVLLNLVMSHYGIITLTAPFVLVTWVIIAVDKGLKNKKLKPVQ